MLIPSKFSGYRAGRRVYPKKGDAPAPDPAAGEAALRQVALNERQYNEYIGPGGDREFIRGVTNEALGIQRGTAERTNALSDYQLEQMRANNDRYWDSTVPYQNALDADIDRLYSPEGINNQVNTAVADVNAATANSRGQMQRGMTRIGVNPMSGAYASMGNATSVGQASAMASAANKTRTAAEQAGLATKFQSLGAKLGMAGLGSTNAGLATSAMGTGLSAAGGMSGSAASMIGANNQSYGAFNSGMAQGISGYNNFNANQISAANANAQNDPFNSLLGMAAGVGGNLATGYGLKALGVIK